METRGLAWVEFVAAEFRDWGAKLVHAHSIKGDRANKEHDELVLCYQKTFIASVLKSPSFHLEGLVLQTVRHLCRADIHRQVCQVYSLWGTSSTSQLLQPLSLSDGPYGFRSPGQWQAARP